MAVRSGGAARGGESFGGAREDCDEARLGDSALDAGEESDNAETRRAQRDRRQRVCELRRENENRKNFGESGMNSAERQNYREKEAALAWRADTFAARAAEAGAGEQQTGGFLVLLQRELVAAWAACGAFEWVALGYLTVSGALIAIFAENLPHPAKLIGVQAFVAAMILALCAAEARAAERTEWRGETFSSKFWRFWRHWYPHLFFLFCFEEMGKLVHLVTPGWQDARLIAFDRSLTDVNPSLWLERFAHPALNEFMQFAYFTYFLYLLILGGILYYRRDWESYWAAMTYSAVGYVFGYVIAMLFPVQSPWFTLAGMWHGGLAGVPSARLVDVRFDSVRAKPLCGRCVRRNGDGNVGVRDRQLGDEEARRRGDSLALKQRARESGMCALEGVSDANEKIFISDGTNELEADRQTLRRETAGDR